MTTRLVSYDDDKPDLIFPVAGGQVTIGRDPGSHIQLPDAKVSRHHAVLEPDENGWSLRDLDSSNGSFVNGERVDQRGLQHGDCLQLGPFTLYYLRDVDPDDFVPSHAIDMSTQTGQTTIVG